MITVTELLIGLAIVIEVVHMLKGLGTSVIRMVLMLDMMSPIINNIKIPLKITYREVLLIGNLPIKTVQDRNTVVEIKT